jgi:hypothetical protein
MQVPDMTTHQWAIFLEWIKKTLRGKPGLNVTMEQALELVPFAHKVCHDVEGSNMGSLPLRVLKGIGFSSECILGVGVGSNTRAHAVLEIFCYGNCMRPWK